MNKNLKRNLSSLAIYWQTATYGRLDIISFNYFARVLLPTTFFCKLPGICLKGSLITWRRIYLNALFEAFDLRKTLLYVFLTASTRIEFAYVCRNTYAAQ